MEAAYRASKRVYKGELSQAEGTQRLDDGFGVNFSSAKK